MPRKKHVQAPQAGVRERLLETADRLFYKEGVRAVGIDRVLAEAGAAKASLYSHFHCKDELVAAYVKRRTTDARAHIEAYVANIPPAGRALRFFDWVVEWTNSRDFRGCPLQHIVGELNDPEHPARTVATEQREWIHARFLEWARAAGVTDPLATAGALVVLFDGAIAASEQDGPKRARDARWMAKQLLSRSEPAAQRVVRRRISQP
ncbi:MAG: TetR/AcrR family transcriptional regulator [Steroidobacteraceae bacterium]